MADIRSIILETNDISVEKVVIPEWGNVEIEIHSMTGRDRAALQKKFTKEFDMEAWYTELVLACVFDPESGKRVFEPADRKEIGGKSAKVLERIASIATRLSGMADDSVAEAERDIKSE